MMNTFEIEPKLKSGACQELYSALAKAQTREEIAQLLRDVLTYEEIEEAARRLQVARLLDKKQTFRDISAQTKMSTATIARINWWLHHGTGGYRLALEGLSKVRP
jgi:TrpR-related protein YerC/YecD